MSSPQIPKLRPVTVIVAGKLTIKPGSRDEFVRRSQAAVLLARQNEACADFAVSADPSDPDRVNIFEKWASRQALEAFRSAGPEDDLFTLVAAFDVGEYAVGR